MKVKRVFYRTLYIFAKKLPPSNAVFFGKIAKKIRGKIAKKIVVKMGQNVNVERGAVFSSNIEIGDNSGIGINCSIGGKTIIGSDVMMGPECVIFSRNHCFERTDIPMIQQGYSESKEVVIGDDVWIGRRVMILPGVHIGSGVVIGCGAVVTKNIPDYAVVGGIPAKIIRYRK